MGYKTEKKIPSIILSVFIVLLILVGTIVPAYAAPTQDMMVTDSGEMLSDREEQEVSEMLYSINRQTGIEYLVYTIKSLNGEDIETCANRLFRTAGLGDKEKDNGLLLLISYDDRKFRLEVGYGLEGDIPDTQAANIINTMTPYFKEGNYGDGVKAAVKQKESSIPKKRATNSVATFVDMPDDALEECRKKTQANRDQAQADIENYRRSNRGKESVSNQQKAVDALREETEQKRQAVLQAYDDYQKAVASVTLAENRQLVDKIEQLLQKVNTETNRELAAYGIMERQLRNSLASGTSQELAVSQKLLLSAAVIARSAKEISLYMDFISLAKAFQDLAKSVKTSQSKVSEDTTVKVAIKERGEATGEWEKAKEALHKAEAELEKQEMQKALYESNLRTREKRVTSYDAILTNIRKAQQEKQMQSIEKEQSLRHREVFSGGHNAVRSKKQTDALLNEDVSKLSNADIEKVLTFIRTNAKTFRQKLRKLYITQQKKQIDVKKTIEKSVQCDGEIARLYYKKPIKSKANVVMLADISGSCRAMTSLALTYMGLMREVFPGGCHLFVFVNHLVPVDRYFSNENVTSAVESINKSVPSRGIYSNYGVPLKELRYDNTGIINKDTTIVMLGDCRNNKNYSGVEEVEWLSKRASNFFVLNPDPLNKWGQGDSIADLYAKSGATVCRVSSTQDLLTFLEFASLRKQA